MIAHTKCRILWMLNRRWYWNQYSAVFKFYVGDLSYLFSFSFLSLSPSQIVQCTMSSASFLPLFWMNATTVAAVFQSLGTFVFEPKINWYSNWCCALVCALFIITTLGACLCQVYCECRERERAGEWVSVVVRVFVFLHSLNFVFMNSHQHWPTVKMRKVFAFIPIWIVFFLRWISFVALGYFSPMEVNR